MAILPSLNLRKNQTSELSYAQMDANWTTIGTAVDANTTAVSNKADLVGADFIGSVSTRGKLIAKNSDGTNTVDIYNVGPTGAGNGAMAFEVNGTERMRIDKNGNFGLGVSAPSAVLQVRGTSFANTLRLDSATNSGNNFMSFYGANGTRQGYVGPGGNSTDDSLVINNDRSAPVVLATPGGNMRVDASGNVGIGTTAPISKLHVNSGTAVDTYATVGNLNNGIMLGVTAAGTSRLMGYAGGAITFGSYNSGGTVAEWGRFDNAGNFGVGTAGPGAKLDIESGSTALNSLFGSTASTVELALSNSGTTTTPRFGSQANDLYWKTNGSERMRLNSAGQLGIGTTAPDQKLTIASGSDATNANDGVSFYGSSANKQAAILSYNTGSFNGDMRFYTKASGSASTSATERMRIDPFGNLGLGITPAAWNSSSVAMQVGSTGAVECYNGATLNITQNLYRSSSNTWAFMNSGIASSLISVFNGGFVVQTGGSGTAGTAATLTQSLTVDSSGDLLVGVTSGTYHVVQKNVAEGSSVLSVQGGGTYTALFSSVTGLGVNASANAVSVMRNSTTSRSINAAGTINASGADYAEYMEKAAGCGALAKGQIVGVTVTGTLTDKWADAVSFMIKSTNPSYVGGDSWFTEQPPVEPAFILPQYVGSAPPGEPPHEPSAPTIAQPVEPTAPASDANDEAVAAYQATCAQYRTELDAYTAAQAAYQAALSAYHTAQAAYQRTVDTYAVDQKAHTVAVEAAQALFDTETMPTYQTELAAFNERLEAARANVDRIAYCGQVPCNVTGAVPGQYVVPVQDGNGIGGELMALDAMSLAQYARAVGTVQNILPDGRANVRVKPV